MQIGLGKPKDTKDYVLELLKLQCKAELYNKLKTWEIPQFPINGTILKEHACPVGRAMGQVMMKLKEIWTQEEFKSTKEDLLKHLPQIYENLNIIDGKVVKKAKMSKQ